MARRNLGHLLERDFWATHRPGLSQPSPVCEPSRAVRPRMRAAARRTGCATKNLRHIGEAQFVGIDAGVNRLLGNRATNHDREHGPFPYSPIPPSAYSGSAQDAAHVLVRCVRDCDRSTTGCIEVALRNVPETGISA